MSNSTMLSPTRPIMEPHASLLMKWALPFRMQRGHKFIYVPQRMVVRASPGTVIKGPSTEQELEAMLFVARHTDVPVPKVIRTYRRSAGLFIEMEYIEGTNLQDAWGSGLPEATKERIGEAIGRYITKLRALDPPKDFAVGSTLGGPVKDGRISPKSNPPFTTIPEFHQFLRNTKPGLEGSNDDDLSSHQREYRICYSHADICPRNIILKNDGSVVLIDWELAGWWPEYWEYTKCHFTMFKECPGWLELLDKHIPVYSDELKTERLLWRK